MTEQTPNTPPQNQENQQQRKHQGPVFLIPKSFFFTVVAIVIGSFAITLFARNPYTQSIEGGSLYESGGDHSMMMWVAIFIGIPASFWAYKTWILPLFDRK